MVQIVENWSELTGTVRSITGSEKGPEHCTVLVEVEAVADVEGFPNLVDAAVGDVVAVIARRGPVEDSGVTEGSHVRCRVRKATPFEVFVHPDGFTELVDGVEATSDDEGGAAATDVTFDSFE